MTQVDIAIICHEANAALCLRCGDDSQRGWHFALEWQRDSAIKGVAFAVAHPDAPASSQHEAWMEDKRRDGWKHGLVKDAHKKEHPCMVPYDELPPMQRAKDHLFQGIVRALAPFLDK